MAIDPLPTPAPSTSDPTNFSTRADALLGALPTMVTQFNAALVQFASDVTAGVAAVAAAGVAALATINATLALAGNTATSTTSMAVGTGSKSFTIQTGRAFVAGAFIVIADTSAPNANYMLAQITSYNSATGAMVANAFAGVGSGTLTAWTISLSGPGREVPSVITASVSGSYTPDFGPVAGFSTAINFAWTLTGNLTFNVPTNMTNGQSGVIYFIQDGTGSRTLSLHASIFTPGGAALTLSTAAGSIDRCGYFVRGGVLELTALEKDLA